MKKLVVCLLLLALAGCASSRDREGREVNGCIQINNSGWGSGVYRCVDEDAQVVCWVWSSYNQGGVDCLPFSEVRGTSWR